MVWVLRNLCLLPLRYFYISVTSFLFLKGYKWLNQVFCTVSIEFQYYISIGLWFNLIINPKSIFRFLFYIMIFFVQFLASSSFLPYWLPVFLIGILLFLKFADKISSVEFYSVCAVSFGFIFFHIGIASGFVCMFTFCMIFFLSNFSNKITRFFGNISYSIYLIHPLIGASFVNYFSHNAHTLMSKLLVVAAGVCATVFSSYIMYLIIEKPSKKISSNIKFKKE